MSNKALLFLTGIATLANGLEGLNITPHSLLALAFDGDAQHMLLSSPSWDAWNEFPCQYYFDQGFYNLIDVQTNPDAFTSSASTLPLVSPTVYFSFCQKLSNDANFKATSCNTGTNGDYYAISVSADGATCTPLSTTFVTSIVGSTWDNSGTTALAVQYSSD